MGLENVIWPRAFPRGPYNKISDVSGVCVGHSSLRKAEKKIFTGVTAVKFHPGNPFREKLRAGAAVINGFGKSCGLLQLQELGQLESPILLTNTLSVGAVLDALNRRILEENPEIGTCTGTVNAVVCECNDGRLNDIRALCVGEKEVEAAFEKLSPDFEEGDVGAGTGMLCFGLKGGIGSSSRQCNLDGKTYTIGCLVLSNFGHKDYLRINGKPYSEMLSERREGKARSQNAVPDSKDRDKEREQEQGSCIILIATDIPLSSRQLSRLARRSSAGLIRCGSYLGNGSGDIAIAVSTAEKIPHFPERFIRTVPSLHEERMDLCFAMLAEAVEEAVISSMLHAHPLEGKFLSVDALQLP